MLVFSNHDIFKFFVLLNLINLFYGNSQHRLYNRHNSIELQSALDFIKSVQEPVNCTGSSYVVVQIGINGGFAAQFQYAAAEWMRTFAALDFKVPVLIRGRFIGYSDSKACDHVMHDWTCYFQPISSCQDSLLKTGKLLNYPNFIHSDNRAIPKQFRHLGLAFWWGVVQYNMFKFQPVVIDYILKQSKLMNYGNGFPFGTRLAGIHVRHGDKKDDGFKEHSLREEVGKLRRSSDCYVRNSKGNCFYLLNISDANHAFGTIHRAEKQHGIIIERKNMELYNASSLNKDIALTAHELHALSQLMVHNRVYHTSSSASVNSNTIQSSTIHERQHSFHSYHYQQHHQQYDNHSELSSISVEYLIPIQIFVASDDARVLHIAHHKGYLTDSSGVSQKQGYATSGMLKTLLTHPELAHSASLEIISDIFYLSHCSSLIGMCSSQVFRMAVAMSNVTNILKYTIAIDYDQVYKVQQLSIKYGIPFPEQFL